MSKIITMTGLVTIVDSLVSNGYRSTLDENDRVNSYYKVDLSTSTVHFIPINDTILGQVLEGMEDPECIYFFEYVITYKGDNTWDISYEEFCDTQHLEVSGEYHIRKLEDALDMLFSYMQVEYNIFEHNGMVRKYRNTLDAILDMDLIQRNKISQ